MTTADTVVLDWLEDLSNPVNAHWVNLSFEERFIYLQQAEEELGSQSSNPYAILQRAREVAYENRKEACAA